MSTLCRFFVAYGLILVWISVLSGPSLATTWNETFFTNDSNDKHEYKFEDGRITWRRHTHHFGNGTSKEEAIFINQQSRYLDKIEIIKNEYGEVVKFSETSFKYDAKGRTTEIHTEVKDRQNPENDRTSTTTKTYDNGNVTVMMVTKDKTGESTAGPFKETDYGSKASNPLETEYKSVKAQAEAEGKAADLEERVEELEKATERKTKRDPALPPPPPPPPVGFTPPSTPVALGVPADPSFFIGLFGGPSMTDVNGLNADYSDFNAFASLTGKKNLPCASSTMMSGGVRFGTWGNWGIAPEWTKYLGFGMDFSYQKLNINTGMGTYSQTIHPFGVTQVGNVNFSSNGYLATLGFMFYGRYGFLPNDRISTFGTIQPFLGAGPVLGFASVEPTVKIDGDFVRQFGRQSSVFPGFGLETGVRYLPHRNIYLEASYRFFYGQPGFGAFNQENFRYNFNPDITTHNFRFGVGLLF